MSFRDPHRATLLLSIVLAFGCAARAPAPPLTPPEVTEPDWQYALMIDASSSSSTLQIFRWADGTNGALPIIEAAPGGEPSESWTYRVHPGLSAYAGRPAEAAGSLGPLIEYAVDKLGDPATLAETPIHLRATAGMRLLPEDRQVEILMAIGSYLYETPFGSYSARVITGAEEGTYGWLSVNYRFGDLEHGRTVGALDLGGASAQITFHPLHPPRAHGQVVDLGFRSYELYTQSYLGLGQDKARETIDSPDCFPVGYPMAGGRLGRGDFDTCGRAIRAEFAVPCSEDDEPCSLFGVYQPPLEGDFLALSVYEYVADFFDLGERIVPSAVANAGRDFCSTDWPALVERKPEIEDDPYAPLYCYAAAHVEALLTDGFGFPADSERIAVPSSAQGAPTGWTLGALLLELSRR
ncbi:MAG: hypothetical protein ACE5GX_06200 [Thermoanaerobaculia bacterium]